MRQIKINKYEGNTHYSVSVIDSYGKEHHIGYYKHIYTHKLEEKAQEIWLNEVKPEKDLMAEAIKQCIEIDRKAGRVPSLD